MKLIKPNYEIIHQEQGLEGIYKIIEKAGRTCYASDPIEGKAKDFVDRMIKSDHCYTSESEVLTIDGWVKWKNYNGEQIAVINEDRSFKGFEVPQRIISHLYEGTFYNYPEMGIEVTNKHTMFGIFRTSNNDFYTNTNYRKFICDESFKDNNGRLKSLGERMFKIPNTCVTPKNTSPLGELIGFWLGDGCYEKTSANYLKFHLKKERKIKYLQLLCNELNYEFIVQKGNYYKVVSQGIGTMFSDNFYNEGKYINKTFTQSPILIHSIIQGLINSDGSLGVNTKTITFTNTSKSIIDWICINGAIGGYNISYRGICHYTKTNNPVYKILFLDSEYTINNDSRKPNSKVIITNKTEQVYCVTVSTGLIMIRGENGKTSICGNCAMLEHGTIYLKIPVSGVINQVEQKWIKYTKNNYSKVIETKTHPFMSLVTTNLRVLVENNWLEDLQYLCEPTEYHEKRITVKFNTQVAISREYNRHRVNSIAEQSTRYCNYNKNKFGNEISINLPEFIKNQEDFQSEIDHGLEDIGLHNYCDKIQCGEDDDFSIIDYWLFANLACEYSYLNMIKLGAKAQEARTILPLNLNTELIHTAFISDWKHFFNLRALGTTGAPHPDAKSLAEPLMNEFKQLNLI